MPLNVFDSVPWLYLRAVGFPRIRKRLNVHCTCTPTLSYFPGSAGDNKMDDNYYGVEDEAVIIAL